jgi:hypothetical protein
MDALSVSAIIVAITGMLVSSLAVIKHSECSQCLKIDTRTPPNSPKENIQPVSRPPLGQQEVTV